jgi:hypothetical protein
VKRFLWGVDGVKEPGNDVLDELLGGVCDLVGSFMVVECEEESKVESGDRLGGVDCGIVVSKISDRSNVENVRFASSAGQEVSKLLATMGLRLSYFFGSGALHEVLSSSVWKVLLVSHRRAAN